MYCAWRTPERKPDGRAMAGAPLRSPPFFANIEKDNRNRKRHIISSIEPPKKYIFLNFPPFLASLKTVQNKTNFEPKKLQWNGFKFSR